MQGLLRWTQIVLAIGLAVLVLALVSQLATRERIGKFDMVVGGVGVLFALALLARWRIAMRLAAAGALLMAIALPVGVLGPFTAGDYLAQGKEPPAIGETLVWVIPVVLLFLLVAWILDLDPRKLAQREAAE